MTRIGAWRFLGLTAFLAWAGGCSQYDPLFPGAPAGVVAPREAVQPLPVATPLARPADAPPDGPKTIASLTTAPGVDFVTWDDDLEPNGIAATVIALDAAGRPVPLKGRRLVVTLYTDLGRRLERRGKPVMQWEIPSGEFDARRTASLLTGPALALHMAIDRRLPSGYYILETRLVTRDGRHLEALDPALELLWCEAHRTR